MTTLVAFLVTTVVFGLIGGAVLVAVDSRPGYLEALGALVVVLVGTLGAVFVGLGLAFVLFSPVGLFTSWLLEQAGYDVPWYVCTLMIVVLRAIFSSGSSK